MLKFSIKNIIINIAYLFFIFNLILILFVSFSFFCMIFFINISNIGNFIEYLYSFYIIRVIIHFFIQGQVIIYSIPMMVLYYMLYYIGLFLGSIPFSRMLMYMGGDFDGFNPSGMKGLDINRGLFSASRQERMVGYVDGTTSPPRAITPPTISPPGSPAAIGIPARLDPRNSQLTQYNSEVAARNSWMENRLNILRTQDNPEIISTELIRQANSEATSILPFNMRASYPYKAGAGNPQLDISRLRDLLSVNSESLNAITSFEFTDTTFNHSPSINGSISASFFFSFEHFLRNGFQDFFLGFYEKFRCSSNTELTFMNHLTLQRDFEDTEQVDYLDDLTIFNELIRHNISRHPGLNEFFLRIPGSFQLYINNGESHLYNVDVPVNEDLGIPIHDFDYNGINVGDNRIMNRIFDQD